MPRLSQFFRARPHAKYSEGNSEVLRQQQFFRASPAKYWPLGSPARPIKQLLRTPITQLTEYDRQSVNKILEHNAQALARLNAEGLHIISFDHEVKDRQQQFSFLSDVNKAGEFRKERFGGLLNINIFHEIFIDKSLSVSGGVEHGYFRPFIKQHKILKQATKEAICNEWGRYISPLMEGGCYLTLYLGLPTTTLYKADPYTIPIVMLNEIANSEKPSQQDINKTLPGALICEDIKQLTEVYVTAYRQAHQKFLEPTPQDGKVLTFKN